MESFKSTTNKVKNWISSLFEKGYSKFRKILITPTRRIFFFYVIVFLVGTFLLWIPITHAQGFKHVSFIDAMFTSASAFSDTGLSPFDAVYQVFNFWGELTILVLIVVGGLGLFTMKVFILSFFIKKFSYRSYDLVSNEREGKNKAVAIKMVRYAFTTSFCIIFLFGIVLGIEFFFIQASSPTNATFFNDPNGKFFDAFWMGIFTAGSAFNNAGFDITSSGSFVVYDQNIGIQFFILVLFIIGGIGFPLVYETIEWLKARRYGKKYRMSLLAKVLFFSYVLVAFGGLFLVFMIEGFASINSDTAFFTNPAIDMSSGERIWALIFNTFSTRSAGFATINLTYLSSPTLFVYIVMMFIGAGSSSTTGGIRTTTFWILLVFFIGSLKGRNSTHTFNRQIKTERVNQAFMIFIFSLVAISTLSIFITMDNSFGSSVNDDLNYWNAFMVSVFTATSAFGTVGLSIVPIGDMGAVSKILLIVLMFMGQLGISNTLNQFHTNKKEYKHYIEEDLALG